MNASVESMRMWVHRNASMSRKTLWKEFHNRQFRLLDVGCGNHSAAIIHDIFPNCEYYGVDQSRHYSNSVGDFALMHKFYEMDITKLQFDEIPQDYFDAIKITHVIEHLINGDKVLDGLLCKLREGGVIYIEYPRFESTRLPSMRDSLNFYDDPTHVRIYNIPEITNIVLRNGCVPLKSGVCRCWDNLLLMPIQIVRMWRKRGYMAGPDFWNLFGFAEYVFARKRVLEEQTEDVRNYYREKRILN